MNGRKSFRLHGNDHDAGQSISQIGLDGGEVYIVLALLESNDLEVMFSHNLGKDREGEHRQELIGVQRHRLMAHEFSLMGRGGSSEWSTRKRKWQVQQGRGCERESPG